MEFKNSLISQILISTRHWESWFLTAWQDLLNKYKRTKLGSFWNFLAYAITISIMCSVWSIVFKMPIQNLFPYMFNGFVIFFVFTSSVSTSLDLLTMKKKDVYLNLPVPFLSLILREVTQHIFSYFHFIWFILVMYFFLYDFNLINIFLYFLGISIFYLTTIFISSICCIIATRFRDMVPLINSILSAATLISPIIWKKEMLGVYQNWVYLNPLSFMVEIVRSPVLGEIPKIEVYIFNLIFLAIVFILLSILIKKKGHRLVFWI